MQNFGMPGANQGAHPGGGPVGPMYGGQMGGGASAAPPIPQIMPHVSAQAQMHNYRNQLQAWNNSQHANLNAGHVSGQLNSQQFQNMTHQVNERTRQLFTAFQAQLQRMGQMGAGSSDQGQWRGGAPPGAMPPPMVPGQGNMPKEMSAADKKKMAEIQKRMAAQQAQGMRPTFPPGTTPQQQQHFARMHAMQQQQNMQNNGYGRMMPGQQTPQYPPGPLSHQQPGAQPLHHMQPPTPQSHGPASVSSAAHQQFQQQQQQQYYQQQNQLQMQQQQLQLQQQQHQQQQQQMGGPQGMGQEAHGFPGQMQHSQQSQMQHMQQQQLQQQQMQQQQQQQAAQQQQIAPQPAPVPTPSPAAPPKDPEELKKEELLNEMKNQYLEVLERMHQRPNAAKGVHQMINILQGTRVVPYVQLQALKSSLQKLMIRDCPTWPMMEEIRKVVFKKREDREKALAMQYPAERDSLSISKAAEEAEKRLSVNKLDDPLGVETWKSVRHLRIRVPEAIRKLTERTASPSPLEEKRKALKRERDSDADEEPNTKKPKEEDRDETASQTSVDEDASQISPQFVVKTVFDQRKPWIIPPKAREELRQLSNWSIDEHCLPSCSAAPFIIICVKAQSLLVNPLRISLPRTYPQDAASIQFDRSFPQDTEYGPALQKLYERFLGTKSAVKGLTDFVNSYQAACDEYQLYLPKYQVESSPEQQKTPEMMYANHYAARPTATAPIAHKGMVM